MTKTKRDLIQAVSEKIGGEQGQRMRAAFEKPFLKDLKAWDQVLSEEEFESQLKQLEQNIKKAAFLKSGGSFDNPESWGLLN